MADIFVSYASADRDRVKVLAEALAAQGWSVWWDRTIPPGRQFDEVIEEELAAARCVVVLWSQAAVASGWVKTEAADAMARRILVPALIDDIKIPLEFRRLQAADLSAWHPGSPHPPFDEFLGAIATQLRHRPQPGAAGAAGPSGRPADRQAEPRTALPIGPDQSSRRRSRVRSAIAAMAGGLAMIAGGVIGGYLVYHGAGGGLTADPIRERAPQLERTVPPARAVLPAKPPLRVPPRPKVEAAPARVEAASGLRPASAGPVDVSGRWRDTTWGHVSEIAQKGDSFGFTVWGNACRGGFRSSGTGTLEGHRFESAYRSTMPSEGRCSGTVSPDGTQIRSTCVDSVCGAFASSAVRQ